MRKHPLYLPFWGRGTTEWWMRLQHASFTRNYFSTMQISLILLTKVSAFDKMAL